MAKTVPKRNEKHTQKDLLKHAQMVKNKANMGDMAPKTGPEALLGPLGATLPKSYQNDQSDTPKRQEARQDVCGEARLRPGPSARQGQALPAALDGARQ